MAMKNAQLPKIVGKTVSFALAGQEFPRVVAGVAFEMHAGRLFAIGTVPRGTSDNDWAVGVKCAVAWDQVQDYMVFDSKEDYEKRVVECHE